MSATNNIANRFVTQAENQPYARAIVLPAGHDRQGRAAYRHLTFRELNRLADRYAWGLKNLGVEAGMKALLMVRPGFDFYALTFAMFKVGAVPVLIDPGMGWRAFMRCVSQAEPDVFLGVPAAHVLRLLFPRYFRSIAIRVTLGRRWFWGGASLADLGACDGAFPVQPVEMETDAAVLFTTGSTGPAKGVVYSHRVFCTQVEILRREYGIAAGDIDLPCFPLFGLFSTALGATAVIPDMDPSRPAHVDPMRIVEPILDHGVTYSFGSPTLWQRVGAFCRDRGIECPSLRRIIMAGAPVPGRVHRLLLEHVLPAGAETFTPYGATECLPVCNFRGSEMLASTDEATRQGAGMCVGKPVSEATVRILRTTDEPVPTWDEGLVLGSHDIGEVTVTAPMATRTYHRLPEANRLAKIADGEAVWHRMGDLGYLDDEGRLWVCGRKSHRVETKDGTLYTVRCEALFNELEGVYRSALVGIGPDRQRQRPVIIIEPLADRMPSSRKARKSFEDRVLSKAASSPLTQGIRDVLFHPSFPVDIRHNAKIRREVLAEWARGEVTS